MHIPFIPVSWNRAALVFISKSLVADRVRITTMEAFETEHHYGLTPNECVQVRYALHNYQAPELWAIKFNDDPKLLQPFYVDLGLAGLHYAATQLGDDIDDMAWQMSLVDVFIALGSQPILLTLNVKFPEPPPEPIVYKDDLLK